MGLDSKEFNEVKGMSTRSFHKKIDKSSFDKYSDQELWNMFANGNQSAFTYIYSNYINRLYNFGCQITTDKELVRDNIQDLFIRLRTSEKKTQVQSIKSFLYKSLYWQLMKSIKKQKKTINIEENEKEPFRIRLSVEQKIINTQLNEAKVTSLNQALNELNIKQRQAILLYYYEEVPYSEIAEIFQLKNVKSARKLIYRSIEKIRNSVWFKSVEFFVLITITHLV